MNAYVLPSRKHWFVPFVFASAIGYVSMLTGSQVGELELERAIERYERNGESHTPEAQRAMKDWASDTGRTFAPFLGIPITLVWTTINFAALSLVEWSFRTDYRSLFSRRATSVGANEPQSSDRISRD